MFLTFCANYLFVVKCDELGTTPITHMTYDFDPPLHGVSSFLDYSDLEKILAGVRICRLCDGINSQIQMNRFELELTDLANYISLF